MNLYFVSAEEGEMNLDWFIIANNPQEAQKLWQDLPEVQDFDDREHVIRFICSAPAEYGDKPRALCWHNDLVTEINSQKD